MHTTEQIWNEYHSKLYHFVKKRVGDPSQAEDLVQDIMIKIHSKMETLESQEKIQGWIYQIARNTLVDFYRTHKPGAELPLNLTAPQPDQIEQARQEIKGCLNPLIQNLPPHYREAILLSEMEELPQKEVASLQNISLSGAKSRIQRGRRMLKEMLMQCCTFQMDSEKRVIDYQPKEKCKC